MTKTVQTAFTKHTVEDFLKYDQAELRQKRFIANLAIQVAKQGLAEGDERAPQALAYYREERRLINQALQEKVHGEEGPPAQAVGLKALTVAGTARKDNGQDQRRGVASLEDFLKLFSEGKQHGRR